MVTFKLICICYTQLFVCWACDYIFENVIDITENNKIGDIFVGDTISLSFELQINSLCNFTNCDILHIGDNHSRTTFRRLPLISLSKNPINQLWVSFSTNSNFNDAFQVSLSTLNQYTDSNVINGDYNKM
eukprot:67241_1